MIDPTAALYLTAKQRRVYRALLQGGIEADEAMKVAAMNRDDALAYGARRDAERGR